MRRHPATSIGLVLGALLGSAAALFSLLPLAVGFEAGPYDLLSRWHARPQLARSSRVRVLLVTDDDLRAFRAAGDAALAYFPPPRTFWIDVAQALLEKAPAAVVIDVVLAGPSRIPGEDQEFGQRLADAGGVVLPLQLFQLGAAVSEPQPLPDAATVAVSGASEVLATGDTIRLPIEQVLGSATRIGNAFVTPDGDGVIRRMPIATRYGDSFVPSLATATAMTALGESGLHVAADGRSLDGIAGSDVPLAGDGNLLLRFRGERGTFPTTGVSNLLAYFTDPTSNPLPWFEQLEEGDIVVIGVNVTGNSDLHTTPTDDGLPGAELVATAVDNLIRGDALTRPPRWALLLLPVLLGALVGGATLLGSRHRLGLLFAIPLVLSYLGAAHVLFGRGLVLDVVSPLSGAFLAYLGAALFLFRTEGRERREIRRTFSQYVSEDVVSELEQNPRAVRLGGEQRVMTVLFSDIAGFTGLSERLSPEELVTFLNEYLTRMTDILLDHHGVIDKYEGDAIMAFWGAPIPRADHALRALEASAALREELARFSAEKQAQGLPPLDTRVGLNTGPMVVGNMGSSRRFDYTVIGDSVNLASRLEGANKFFGSTTMLTDATLAAAGERLVVTRALGRLRVKGRAEPVAVHELLGAGGAGLRDRPEWVLRFEEGVGLFENAEFASASEAFRASDALRPGGDPPACRYAELCGEYGSTAPAAFDGVITLTEK